jgi:aminoglycoside phosphotransferase (APT) family kinase protein
VTTVFEDTGKIVTEAQRAVRQLELRPGAELTLLESSWKSTVLRATWRHPDSRGVVLKRCDPGSAEIQATVHGEVLPRIPIRAPRLFGVWREGPTTWLALEDMGDEAPRLDDDRQRAMVSRWLGELHRASRDLAGAPPLPADRGAPHYLGLLESARDRLAERQGVASSADDRRRLARAIHLCDSLRSRWDAVESTAASLAPAFVHADVAPENLRIVRSATNFEVTAIDWEKAGIGTPFADLAIADPPVYAWVAGAPLEVVSSAMWVARLLAALSHNWAVKPMREVERYARRIERALGSIRER